MTFCNGHLHLPAAGLHSRLVGRNPRINLADLTYHVWANGVSGTRLFRDDHDRDIARQFLAEEVQLSKWICLAYVFMSTHYHLLLRLNESTLSSGFQRLNLRYARHANKRHKLRGHVFDAPFEYKIVEGRFGELEVSRYLCLNPVRANMCSAPEDYPWSSYGALIGCYGADGIVDPRAALAPLGGSPTAYRRYVEQGDLRVRWDHARTRSALELAAPAAAT